MADSSHKGGFPTQADISQFLRSLSEKPDGLIGPTQLAYGTVEKWYRDKPNEMSAVNLLRVVVAMGAEKEFARWLADYGVAMAPREKFLRVAEKAEKGYKAR